MNGHKMKLEEDSLKMEEMVGKLTQQVASLQNYLTKDVVAKGLEGLQVLGPSKHLEERSTEEKKYLQGFPLFYSFMCLSSK